MPNRQLSQAFEQWQEVAVRMKAGKCGMSGAIRRMLDRKLSQAFKTCRAVVAAMKADCG